MLYRISKYDHVTYNNTKITSQVAGGISDEIQDTAACLLTVNPSHGHASISEMLIHRTTHYGLRSRTDLTLVMPGDIRTQYKTGLCDATLWYNIECMCLA